MKIDLNSLASIESAAGLLGEEDTPSNVRQELVDIISTECEHLSVSIVGLLQQERWAAPPEIREADLRPIIEAAVREAEFLLLGHGVVVRNESPADLPPIRCNPDQVRNLLVCLAMNSVQAVPAGSKVVITASRADDGIILNVGNRGNRSFIRRMAKRFIGPRPVTIRAGLAAAYDIVRRHGGRIDATVNVRKGMEFSVWLPLHRNGAHGSGQNPGGGGR